MKKLLMERNALEMNETLLGYVCSKCYPKHNLEKAFCISNIF